MSASRHLLRKSAIVSAGLLVLGGALLGAFQLVVSRVPAYRVQLQDFLQESTGLAIEFRELNARLRLHGPELVFKGIVVRTPDRTRVLASALRGRVAFDLWESLRSRQLTSGWFTLESPQLGLIRTRDGRIQLIGQSALPERDKPFELNQLPVGRFEVRDAMVSFRDEATSRGPWSLSGVSFTLDRQRELLDLRGTAALPAALGKTLSFAGKVHGALGKPQQLFSSFTVTGDQVDLAGWADMLPDDWPAPDSGHGMISISAAFHGTTLSNVAAKIDLHNVTAVAPAWTMPLPQAEPLKIPLAAGEVEPLQVAADKAQSNAIAATGELISYQHIALALRAQQRVTPDSSSPASLGQASSSQAGSSREWTVVASDMDFSRADSSWRSREMQFSWRKDEAGKIAITGQADRLVLQNVWPLLAYLPESAGVAQLRAMRARGEINALSFQLERADAQQPWRYNITAGLQDIGVQPVLKAPGIDALTAQLRATDTGGEVTIDARALQFAMPSMFRTTLPLRSITAAVQWQREPDSWRITSNNLELDSVDGQLSAVLTLTLPHNGSSPVMDMRARVRNADATATPKYLPASKLTVRTLAWLDHAFTSGRVIDSNVILKGPLRSFPFRKRDGQFVARAQVENITFNYQDGWTPATKLAADVEFRNEGMSAWGIVANVGDMRIHDAHGEFPDFHAGDISIKANASGDFGHALTFLRASPVGPALGPLFARLRGTGPIDSSVSLWLPLTHIADRRIDVTTQFKDAAAHLEGIDAQLSALQGSLTVQQTLLSGADLQGRLLGGPVAIRIAKNSPTASTLTANGRAHATQLIPHLPTIVRVSGATDWQASTQIRAGQSAEQAKQTQSWQITAAMDGLGVAMPYPVGKSQQGARALHAELEVGDAVVARAAYGDMRALLRVQHQGERWVFDRASVRADAVAASLPAHRGLRIEGDIDRLVLDDWLALRGAASAASDAEAAAGKLSDVLQAANVHVDELNLYGYRWNDVRGVLQATATGWRVDVAGPDALGTVQIPATFTGDAPLTATMGRLLLRQPESEGPPQPEKQGDPRAWPNLRINVDDLQVDEHTVGDFELKATRVPTGLQFDAIKSQQAHALGEASGSWLLTPDGERSSLALKIVSTDVGDTLRTLKYPTFLEARRAEIHADLAWKGGFGSNFLGRASGSLTVAAEAGQMSTLQPGAGRVLGLFSVAALPRRLALDFSDVTDKGLGFDTVHGDFELREGNAYTTNLTLHGPAADIGIVGRTGLGTHDYDQTAVVTGNLGASLPVAGALAGGPAIGAAMLLFTQVFKEPLKGMTRGYYRITGSWDEPMVERVEAASIKEAGASNRLVH